MKKLTTILFTITILFAFNGCEKDPFKPGEDNNEHPIIWQYKYDQHQISSEVIPAMDEKGNIFFSIQIGERPKDVYVYANDKEGNALWNKEYSSSNYVNLSRVMYIDNKLIYVVSVYDDLYYYQETIYCVNAENGSEIWQYAPDFKNEKIIEAMAATSDYLVVGAKWGGDYPAIDELHYFNISSGALFKSIDLGDDEVKNMSIVGSDIFLGVRTSGVYYTPKLIKMNLESNNISWSFNPEYEDEIKYIFENRSIAIDGNGRAFCVISKEYMTGSAIIYIINNDGTVANIIAATDKMDGTLLNTLIDKDNNFYAATHNYVKYSPDGSQIWEFYSGTDVPNSNFRTGCILADNDIVYHAEQGGILNVNGVGEIAWAKYNETSFTYPGYPLLTDDGNMVVVGDLFVTCVKGDGAKIQVAPWPRIYQNNGNTASR